MSKSSNKAHGGIAPFGYKWIGARLVLDSTEAPVRKLIFELFLKHRRKKTVAKVINDLGHRTRNGSLFSDTTIGRLLTDPIVIGKPEVNRGSLSLEPLVTKEIWENAQALLADRRTKQTLRLFTGLVYCDCGGKMLVSSGSSKYACSGCRRKIGESDLEEILHTKLGDRSIFETSELYDHWYELPAKDRRLLIEHMCDRVVVCKDSIRLEFSYSCSLLDAPASSDSNGGNAAQIKPEPRESLLSEAQAAKFLGVSKMTLSRKRIAGDISFFRVGSRILYSKEKHLLIYLSRNENKRL